MQSLDRLLAEARRGDPDAVRELLAIVYDDLRRLARARLRTNGGFTLLDTTGLLHESLVRLLGLKTLPVDDRGHFFAYASKVMRSVVTDFARARSTERRGGDIEHVTLTTAAWGDVPTQDADAVRVHEALEVLERADERLAKVVEMRFYGGLSEADIALSLGVHERTVRRDLVKARLLLKELLD